MAVKAMLRGEAHHPGPAPPGHFAGTWAPAQLPADVPAFTGRSAELRGLDDPLAAADRAAAVVSAVSGTAGVGKTAFAVHWAHGVLDHFLDGQLYVDLRGFDPDQPLPINEALASLLRALGVNGPTMPPDPADRASLYRTLVAGRRMFVLLDHFAAGLRE